MQIRSNGARVWRRLPITLTVSAFEAGSPYACPFLGPIEPWEADMQLLFARLAARLQASPIRSADQEATYPLLCTDNRLAASGRPAIDDTAIDKAAAQAISDLAAGSLSVTAAGNGGYQVSRPGQRTPSATVRSSPAGWCLVSVNPAAP